MDVVRLIVEALLVEAARSLLPPVRPVRDPAAAELPYDAYALETRPLPAGLRLFPHPREVSAEAAGRITGGAVR